MRVRRPVHSGVAAPRLRVLRMGGLLRAKVGAARDPNAASHAQRGVEMVTGPLERAAGRA